MVSLVLLEDKNQNWSLPNVQGPVVSSAEVLLYEMEEPWPKPPSAVGQ